jgi:hypothetical protein
LIHNTSSVNAGRLTVSHKFDTDEQSRATHVAHDLVTLLQVKQAGEQTFANRECVCL